MPDPTNLRIPGPTPLPAEVRAAGARDMVNHRGAEFREVLDRVTTGLQRALRTTNDVLLLTASGTGGLEAMVVNTLSPGDHVLSVSIGAFGERLAAIATRYGANVTRLDVTPGHAADPLDVAAQLDAMDTAGTPARAVLVTHNETSTGVTNPLAAMATVIRETAPQALLLVDGISGVGAVPFETDAWGVDIVVTGSQKSWMVPPGLAMVSVSPRAWDAARRARMPRYYFDLQAARDSAARGETPWTPAVGICFALDVALGMLEAEGYPAIFARHAALGAATRAGVQALGFHLFADPAVASDTVTSVVMPSGVAWPTLDRELQSRGLVLAGGQGSLSGRIFRLGHLGDVHLDDILAALAALEDASQALGIPVTAGVAGSAASAAAASVLDAARTAAGAAA